MWMRELPHKKQTKKVSTRKKAVIKLFGGGHKLKHFGFYQPMSSKMLSHESFCFHPEPNKDDFYGIPNVSEAAKEGKPAPEGDAHI